jgi:hypothetical protein
MTNFAAGWNMAGYGAEPDNVWVFDSFESAIAYLVAEVEHWWDGDYMGDDDPAEIDGRYLDAHTALHNAGTTGSEFSTVVHGANGYPTVLWVVPTDEPMEEE